MTKYVLALDQGTTSSRAIVFAHDGSAVSQVQQEFPQILPAPGNVEHDPEAIWSSQLETARQALARASLEPNDIASIGIANQRETTVLWDRVTGKPVANAIVWQSRVSAPICERLRRDGLEPLIRERTGLVLDPYFSGSKIMHLLESQDGLRSRAERGQVLFGTIDSFLIWRLSGGRLHVTDVSNASRTLLFNLRTLDWDDELLKTLNIPRAMLPTVVPSSQVYGETDPSIFGSSIRISGSAGDQQAATFGQACFDVGSVKNTYGTGCFMLMNIGDAPQVSHHNLLTTVGWSINNKVTYCLEGSVFVAGAVVQWLRDGLGIIRNSAEVEALAATVPDSGGVYIVPAFVGMGAPHWDPYARGSIFGITRGTTSAHLARAALESMAYQSRDLVHAMRQDSGVDLRVLKVDGGASINNLLMQFQADILDVTVHRPRTLETTALGAAYLAGLAVGFWRDLADVSANWILQAQFSPKMSTPERECRCERWHEAVRRSLNWEVPLLQ